MLHASLVVCVPLAEVLLSHSFLRNSNKIDYNADNATKPVHKWRGCNTGDEDTVGRRAVGAEGVL